MKKYYPLFLIAFLFASTSLLSQPICNANGNVIIYSNYDGEIRSMQASSSTSISLEGEAAGIYFIRLLTEKGMYSQRLVISE